MFETLLGNTVAKTVQKAKKFDLVHQTVSPRERVGLETTLEGNDFTEQTSLTLRMRGMSKQPYVKLESQLFMSCAWEIRV